MPAPSRNPTGTVRTARCAHAAARSRQAQNQQVPAAARWPPAGTAENPSMSSAAAMTSNAGAIRNTRAAAPSSRTRGFPPADSSHSAAVESSEPRFSGPAGTRGPLPLLPRAARRNQSCPIPSRPFTPTLNANKAQLGTHRQSRLPRANAYLTAASPAAQRRQPAVILSQADSSHGPVPEPHGTAEGGTDDDTAISGHRHRNGREACSCRTRSGGAARPGELPAMAGCCPPSLHVD